MDKEADGLDRTRFKFEIFVKIIFYSLFKKTLNQNIVILQLSLVFRN